MDRIVFKSTKKVILWEFSQCLRALLLCQNGSIWIFAKSSWRLKLYFKKTFLKSLVSISNHLCKNWRSKNRTFSTSTSIWTKKSCHACSLASMKRPIFADADADGRGRTDADGHGFFERLLHKSPKGTIKGNQSFGVVFHFQELYCISTSRTTFWSY